MTTRPVPKPAPTEKKRKWLRPRNDARANKMRARNFPAPEPAKRWCVVALALQAHQRRHGPKMIPPGWLRCWGPVDPAHVVHTRGMGGCNSDKTFVIDLCRGHHREQEGQSAAFEEKYSLDLADLAARRAAGARDPEPPA